MVSLSLLFDGLRLVWTAAAPDMPPALWMVTLTVWGILGIAALIDALKKIVPDPLILLGAVGVTAALGFAVSWEVAAQHLRLALASALIIWAINALWYARFKRDALGMGDAKWTLLAVLCFGPVRALVAWGGGAILAVFVMGVARLAGRRLSQVSFAPFLFVGLSAASWILSHPIDGL